MLFDPDRLVFNPTWCTDRCNNPPFHILQVGLGMFNRTFQALLRGQGQVLIRYGVKFNLFCFLPGGRWRVAGGKLACVACPRGRKAFDFIRFLLLKELVLKDWLLNDSRLISLGTQPQLLLA